MTRRPPTSITPTNSATFNVVKPRLLASSLGAISSPWLKAARAGEDDAKLTELERAGKERDKWRSDFETLEGSLKKERVNARALEAAGKLGAIEPAAVANLLSADKVEWDDELQPTNVDELIAAVKKDYPRLFSAAPGKGNGGDRPAKEVNADTSPYGRLRNAYASSR